MAESYKRVEIPHHVLKYINTELSMYRVYKAAIEEMEKDIADLKAQSKNYSFNPSVSSGGFGSNPAQDAAIRISVLEEKIKAKKWRTDKVEKVLQLFSGNDDAMNIIRQKYLSEADFNNEQIMAAVGLASNRNRYYELLNRIQYSAGVIFGVMP